MCLRSFAWSPQAGHHHDNTDQQKSSRSSPQLNISPRFFQQQQNQFPSPQTNQQSQSYHTSSNLSQDHQRHNQKFGIDNYRLQFASLPTRLIMPTTTTTTSRIINNSNNKQKPMAINHQNDLFQFSVPPSSRQARQQRQINADRRQSNGETNSHSPSPSNQNNNNNNNNDKLLICYYTTRDSIQNLPPDTREYLIPSDSLSKLHIKNNERSTNQKSSQQWQDSSQLSAIVDNGLQLSHANDNSMARGNIQRAAGFDSSGSLINNFETFVPSNGKPIGHHQQQQQQQHQQFLFKSASLQSPTLSQSMTPQQNQVYFNGPSTISTGSVPSSFSFNPGPQLAQHSNQSPAYSLIGNAQSLNEFAPPLNLASELIDLGSTNSETTVLNGGPNSRAAVPALLLGSGSSSMQFFAPSIRASFRQPVTSLSHQAGQVHFGTMNNNNGHQQSQHKNFMSTVTTSSPTTTSMASSPSGTIFDSANQQQKGTNYNGNSKGATLLSRLERADVISGGPLSKTSLSASESSSMSMATSQSQIVFPSAGPATRASNTIIVGQHSTTSTPSSVSNTLGGQNARSSTMVAATTSPAFANSAPIFELPDSKGQIFVPQLIIANPGSSNNMNAQQSGSSTGAPSSLMSSAGSKFNGHQELHSVASNSPKFPHYQVFDSSPSQLLLNSNSQQSSSASNVNSAGSRSMLMKQQHQQDSPATIFNNNNNNNHHPNVPLSPASSALLSIQNSGGISAPSPHLTNNQQYQPSPYINQSEIQLANKYWPASAARQSIGGSSSPAALVSSPLSSMFDVFGAASQYLMRFKPSSFIGQPGSLQIPISSLSSHSIPQILEQNLSTQNQLTVKTTTTNDNLNGTNSSSNVGNTGSNINGPLLMSPINSLPVNQQLSELANSDKQQSIQYQNHSSPGQSSSSAGSGSSFLSRLVSSSFGLTGNSQSGSSNGFQRREDVCGRTIQTPERRIIGGEGARYGEFPYQVHIKIAKHQCGGALVDRQSIVTAAHCVYHFITRAPVNKLQIVIGAYDIEDEQYQELPPQYFKVNKVKLHPNFRFSASHPDRYDVAILKLDKPVKYTDNVLPVCLPGRDLNFESMVGTVTGFGKTDPSLSNRYGTRLLQKVDVPIIENSECERWHRTRGIDLKIFPEMMCAGYEDGLKDACVGDSGGPLVVKSATGPNGAFRWTLAGITSAGFGCAQSRQPGIYHRVSHTVDWILENLD